MLSIVRPADANETAAAVRHILDTERPAHTTYHVCVVEPRMTS